MLRNEAGSYTATFGSFIATVVRTAACATIANTAADAAQASLRGAKPAMNSEIRPAKSNERRAGALLPSASMAANSFSMQREDGAPSISLRWMVSLSSSRTRSYCN